MHSSKNIIWLMAMTCLVFPPQMRRGPQQQAQGERYYEQGKKAYEAGDLKSATELFLQSAQLGNPAGEMQIGWHYEFGLGVRDYAQARYWYTQSADQGYRAAIGALGGLYFFGKGVPVDYSKALSFYTKAAIAGHANSQYQLGYMNEHGLGTQPDLSKALEWYERAARDPRQTQARHAVSELIPALANQERRPDTRTGPAAAYREAQHIGLAVFPGAQPVAPYAEGGPSVIGPEILMTNYDAYFATASSIDEVSRFYRSKYPTFDLEKDPKGLPKGTLVLAKLEAKTEPGDIGDDERIIILNAAEGTQKSTCVFRKRGSGPGRS